MPRPDTEDEFLNRLRYDEKLGWYRVEAEVDGAPVELFIEADRDDLAPVLTRARQLVADLEKHARGAKDYAVARFLNLKNEEWLEDDEAPVTPEEFRQRMALQFVSVFANGDVAFYHADGGMFRDHTISIVMDGNDQFVGADVPG